jgi:hypothetical protein
MLRAFDCGEPRLYHYQSFNEEHLVDVLTSQSIYFSPIGNFNDPWDCRPFFNLSDLKDPVVRSEIAEWLISLGNPPDHPAVYRYEHLLRTDPLTLRRSIMALSQRSAKVLAANWRIYCLTPKPTHTLMWSHYADKHRGICLEFDVQRGTIFGNAEKVSYCETYPNWHPHLMQVHGVETFLVKAACWNYEEEYRIIARVPNQDLPPGFAAPILKESKLPLPLASLLRIITGCEMPPEHFRRVKVLGGTHAPGVAIQKIGRRHAQFELEL